MGLPNTQIPRDKLPECWSDDVRMNALFAPFRIKTANPESWDMKMKFWSEMVRQYCRHRTDPVISAADIKFAFQRKGRTPACIDIVIEEMYRNGELSPISKYLQILHNGPEGWAMWGARIAFKPAVLAVSTVLSLLPSRPQLDSDGLPKASIESTQRFILESAVKEQATQFLDNFPSGEQRLGTIDELMKITQWAGNRETLEILLGYLVSQGAAVKKGDVVKLAEPNKKAAAVTETDEALVKLTSAETRLEADMERLTKELNSADADARAALKLGNRLAAKNHLRRKHKISTRAQRCDAALENVRHLLHQMREVDSNAAIVDTYRTSSQAMKRTMKEGGLEEDSVFDTMDELKDVKESSPKQSDKKPIAVSEAADNGISIPKSTKPSKAWYPPPGDCLKPDTAWSESGVDASLKRLSEGFGELRMDQRLHPGQPLDVDFTTPPRHYVTDFQVRDHKRAPAGVWLYNHEDTSAELAPSTEYISTESPGKTGSSFLMAPGEGRRKQEPWHTDEEKTIEDLETRLNRLRGFNM
ncbi:Charged multivesicular body protein 7 [Papilio xuthus]|uniref:Charged multivesicular body protein 7 n=1 Tax=Papilio xuthus TaxID=66420 RepID=A0A194Q1P2_PAPXU|nr:Charged multivesicular body protein 7 [Papilio xuthus]